MQADKTSIYKLTATDKKIIISGTDATCKNTVTVDKRFKDKIYRVQCKQMVGPFKGTTVYHSYKDGVLIHNRQRIVNNKDNLIKTTIMGKNAFNAGYYTEKSRIKPRASL